MRRTWFTFYTSYFTPTGEPGVYHVFSPTVLAQKIEYAYKIASRRVPQGYKILGHSATWAHQLPTAPDFSCNLCGAPWNHRSGHFNRRKGQMWCSTCTKEMVRLLWSWGKRYWGGSRFYDHAIVPQGDTTAEDAAWNAANFGSM